MVRLFGFLGAKRSDQILVPGVPGYKPYNLYAFRGANPAVAKKIDPSLAGKTAVIFHSTSSTAVNIAQIAAFNLSKIGMKTNDKPVPGAVYYKTLGTKGVDFDLGRAGWCADYFDPFDYVNVNLDGRSIQAQNNVNFAYVNSASLDKLMDAAANQTGAARAKAYQKLDYTIMKQVRAVGSVRDRQRRVLRVVADAQLRLLVVLRRAGLQRALGRVTTDSARNGWRGVVRRPSAASIRHTSDISTPPTLVNSR